jgi:glycerol-3-phosphate dehydrogenase
VLKNVIAIACGMSDGWARATYARGDDHARIK